MPKPKKPPTAPPPAPPPAEAAPAAPPPPAAVAAVRPTETVRLDTLREHPRNYKTHPPEQLDHIEASLRQHGWYKNIVVARDWTILAGHGVRQAALRMGLTEGPVVRLPIDPDSPPALKILAADNELGKFAETDDRALTELLRTIKETDLEGLLGTGFDDAQLAGLVMVTRPASEIADQDAASQWVGMPEFEPGEKQLKLIITFPTEEDRARYCAEHNVRVDKKVQTTWGARWPWTDREDVATLRFQDGPPEAPAEGGGEPPT